MPLTLSASRLVLPATSKVEPKVVAPVMLPVPAIAALPSTNKLALISALPATNKSALPETAWLVASPPISKPADGLLVPSPRKLLVSS